MLEVVYYETGSGRSEPADYIVTLPVRVKAQALADIEAWRLYGTRAPVSWKPLRGHRPLFEIRVGGHRFYCVTHEQRLWLLQAGPKAHQGRDIEKAAKRMKHVLGE